jgi:S1-C subfamily serine protease
MIGLLSATVTLVNYNIQQTAEASKQKAIEDVNVLLQAQQKFSLPEGTSYTPSKLDDKTLVNVIAKNQPSVVRIATLYCADITLSSVYAVENFTNRCTGHVGSGSFISSDGYIATSGHVVSVDPAQALVESLTDSDDVARYLNYLVASRLMTSYQAYVIRVGVAAEETSAQTALKDSVDLIPKTQINAANATTDYAVQLSNTPITLDTTGSRAELVYGDTIVDAKYVDEDYDKTSSDKGLTTGQFTSSDVALLKAVGSFPYVTLGSIDGLKKGDQLTAIGFPADIKGVDSLLTQTVPSISQGIVKEIDYDSSFHERKIISTSVPIGQGNSGGPAFNDAGEQIGLNTYSALKCADLKCYGDGQVRDVADLKALIKKNNITLQRGGIIDDWTNALTAYTKGNYSDALNSLTKVHEEYPANYLVGSLLNVARQQVGTETDTSASYQAQELVSIMLAVLIGLIAVVTIIMTGLIIAFTIHFHVKAWRTDTTESI